MKKIALTQSFRELRESDCVYVDKTEQIFRLLMTRRTFISRPRGFGKSLLLDTIATLLESGVEPYFRDTWIHDRWTEQKYPVLRLDFSEFCSFGYDEFVSRVNSELGAFAAELGLDRYVPKETPGSCLISLFRALDETREKIAVIIDEYDAPLRANLNKP